MQKNQVILINHPTQPTTFSPFPNQRYPKAAFPNSPTCLNLSRSPTNHQSKNSKIPQSSPSQTLSLSPIPTYLNISPFKKETFLDPSR